MRRLSKALGFPWWDKPAQPCLASRFPYGEGITASRLSRVAQAERWLQQRHFDQVRVRSQGETARIEVPAARLAELMQEGLAPRAGASLFATGIHRCELGFGRVGERQAQPLPSADGHRRLTLTVHHAGGGAAAEAAQALMAGAQLFAEHGAGFLRHGVVTTGEYIHSGVARFGPGVD